MDPVLLRQILENSEPSSQNANPNRAPQATQEGAPTPDEEPGLEVDPEAAQNLMGSIQAGIEGARAGTQGASAGEIIGAAFGGPGLTRDGSEVTKEDRLLDGVATGGAIATGGMKAVFETKDFLFGDTPPEEQSAFRRSVEQLDADMKEASPILGGLSSGVGQFAVAMIGIGKLGKVAQALPKVGEALTAGKTAVEGVKGGAVALESGKAALAGAIAFDPHEARLSNLLQDTPLANPVTAWLAADPNDSAAWGRVKSAMESIGLDAAIIGSLKLGGTVWKKLKAGDTAGASRTITDFEARREGELDGTSEVEPIGEGPDAIPSGDAGAEASPVAAGPVDVPTSEATPSAGNVPEAQDNLPGIRNDGAARFQTRITVDPSEGRSFVDELIDAADKATEDWDLTRRYGNWEGVNNAGHSLNKDLGERFYSQFKSDRDVQDGMRLLVARKAEELEASGWGNTVTDAQFQKQVADFAAMAETDPQEMLGSLQQAANHSMDMPATMVVYGSMTSKIFADATRLGWRMHLGDYSEFGSKEAMEQAIAKRFSLALTMLNDVKAMRASAGRQLRALRGQPFDPRLFEGVSKERFYQLIAESGGDPSKIKYLADPDLYTKLLDTANYLRINSLISGWTTQAINVMSNGYMLGVRPLERILGAVPRAALGDDAAKSLVRENLRQYGYMGSAVWDGFKNASKAFLQNESVLRPHTSEAYAGQSWQVPGSQAFNGQYFKPWDSVPNLIYNALSVPISVASVPSRTLGSVDELMKQIVYRSKLMARAHTEGVESALDAGLSGKAATDYVQAFVKEKVDKAFDAQGRGLEPEALREANIATFQQDLLPGTLGRGVQTFVANEKTKMVRLILPFVKTPTNVLRYGWKMTPGLNVLQGEYRAMLSGKMGREAQAQAVGQMSMGALFMGAAAYLGQDRVTSGGPTDPKVKEQLLATGWRPYSVVMTNEDGSKRYVPFNRMDPIALPFGIIADIQDAIHVLGDGYEENPEVMQAIGALGVSLAKQFTSRTYLLSLNQALEALSQPDRNGEAFFGNMAASLIPFSSATRQTSTDPFMRDARSIADKMVQAIPGMSQTLAPKYNWLGQPVVNRQGLWTDDNGTVVDREVQRLSLLLEGSVIAAPSPLWNKVDLRDIQLVNGENAYVAYQKLAGKPAPGAKSLREQVATRIRSEAYQRAPDGDVGTKGTKLWLLNQIVNKYREAAGKRIRADKNVRDALMRAQRKVVDHYAHLRQEPAEEQKEGLQAVLDAFGAGDK
ncbi:hypothetical protein AGRO_1619 [Agrobacterium sp. ATCC 31749]|uniref:hypothetical protein n=1 Tax=unclassified Agrobacterium TaxID=2632611 RepID=UPI00020DB197|nr:MULTISPECIES: hypothetical protein [unclassified Agrobacterium]EGL65599.1 hypothetical protein AGRO_1619 [Agrobacterium sp. ATCC 31749]QKW97623.1 hypothetical protein GSF67_11300 [Agrobacterium sp. CGMCC 11546]